MSFTARQLISLNRHFYAQVAADFATTRQHAWSGWQQLPFPPSSPTILDVACGNLRFKKFLDQRQLPYRHYLGLDECLPLMQTSGEPAASYRQLDILQHFLDHQDWTTTLPAATYDFVFCSAFLHHVPDTNWRAQLLTQLWGLTTPGGTLAISFWQFLTHPQLSRLIVQDLGHHDYLLSWRSSTTATRYCHHFSDSEIATYRRLLPSLSATAIADYRADGSNRYLVWHKKPRDTSPRGLKT